MAATYHLVGVKSPIDPGKPGFYPLSETSVVRCGGFDGPGGLMSMSFDGSGGFNVTTATDQVLYLHANGASGSARISLDDSGNEVDFQANVVSTYYQARVQSSINVSGYTALVNINATNAHASGDAAVSIGADNRISLNYNADAGSAATDILTLARNSATILELNENGGVEWTPITDQSFTTTLDGNADFVIDVVDCTGPNGSGYGFQVINSADPADKVTINKLGAGTLSMVADVSYMQLASSGSMSLDAASGITLQGAGTGNVKVGTGTPGVATGAGDLYVTSDLETGGGIYLADNQIISANNLDGLGGIQFRSTAQTPDSPMIMTGSVSRAWVFCEYTDKNFDFANPQQSNPTFIFQNADANSIYGRGYIAHDNDDFTFQSHRGGFSFEVPAQYAQGTLTLTGLPTATDTFVINATTCTAVASGASTDEFNIGVSVAETVANIVTMIAAGSEAANVKAWVNDTDDAVVFEWKTAGTAGNSITFTTSLSNSSADGSGTLGGTHAGVAAYTPLLVLENGNVRVGTGTPTYASSEGDFYATGQMECDANLTVSGNLQVDGSGVFGYPFGLGGIRYKANSGLHFFANAAEAQIGYNWIFTANSNYAKDHDRPGSSDPTIFLFSDTDVDSFNTEWGSLMFNGDGAGSGSFEITTGSGGIDFAPDDGTLELSVDQDALTGLLISNVNDHTGADVQIELKAGTSTDSSLYIGQRNPSYTTAVYQNRGYVITDTDSAGILFAARNGTSSIDFYAGEATPATKRLSISSSGNVLVGSGSPGVATGDGDLYVQNDVEIDGVLNVNGDVALVTGNLFGQGSDLTFGHNSASTYGVIRFYATAQTPDTMMLLLGGNSDNMVIARYDDRSTDFEHSNSVDPYLFIQSDYSANSDKKEYASLAWNDLSIGAGKGAFAGLKSLIEEVTITVGNGTGGVATSGNLAPADCLILAVTARITDAPGGGATTVDIGVTGSGNVDELIDGMSTVLNTTANSAADNDGTQLPLANGTATTLTLTTDADVTTDDMKVRVAVFYLDLTEPTA